MFQSFGEDDIVRKKKTIKLMMNGSPSHTFIYAYSILSKKQICKEICSKWKFRTQKIRLFSIEGVEYQTADLCYIRDNQAIYVSRGQDFDSNSNFGQYQVVRTIGEGGFGRVSLARNINTGQLAAIKVLKPNRMQSSQDIDMIFRQAENMKALKHPNIVSIYNCYTLKEMQMVVVMEYMQGGELLDLLRCKKRFSEDQARHYFRQLINAIAYCHRRNIVHRDLKLQNILISQQIQDLINSQNSSQSQEQRQSDVSQKYATIKVSDFGISGVANKLNSEIDSGTLKYMAPEVLSKKEKVNSESIDIWACGVILYYMVCGKLPFTGSRQSEIIQKISKGALSFPLQLSTECTELIGMLLNIDTKTRAKIWEIQNHAWFVKNDPSRKLVDERDKTRQQDLIIQSEQASQSSEFQEKVSTIQQNPCNNYSTYDQSAQQKVPNKFPLPLSRLKLNDNCKIREQMTSLELMPPFIQRKKKQRRQTLNFTPSAATGLASKPHFATGSKQSFKNSVEPRFRGRKMNSNVFKSVLPKRLQKQRKQIVQELETYHLLQKHRKLFRSECKPLPLISPSGGSPIKQRYCNYKQTQTEQPIEEKRASILEKTHLANMGQAKPQKKEYFRKR